MRIIHILFIPIIIVLLYSCNSSKQVCYFQDMQSGIKETIISPQEIKIQPEDKISILVNSKDPQLANLFNLPIMGRQIGQTSTSSSGSNQGVSGYTVDTDGNIDFPVLGKIHVAGMKREEIASFIKNELISKNLVKDPVVTVEFMNLTISVLGEVGKPGRYNIDRDKITLLEAISMAGDLTIYGKRDNVYVMRNEGGKQTSYQVNLLSAQDVYSSPAYYLQQNDVIYVEPNSVRARQSTVNGNNVRSTSFWISLASLLTTITVLFVK